MRVFVSWSKRLSHGLAQALHEWLPEVIHEIDPWMSSEDISKGQRWGAEIGAQLEATSEGIICVTPDNVNEPWLNFEAGALAKSLNDAKVRPVLLDLQPSEVTGPLTQFQATHATDRADMLKFVRSLNEGCERPLTDQRLEKSFDRAWGEFAAKVQQIPRGGRTARSPARDVGEMVSEILDRVREIQRRPALDVAPEHRDEPHAVTLDGGSAMPYRRRREGGGLSGMLLPELQALAASLGITDSDRMRKGELVMAIQDRQRDRPTGFA
jgi:hypothetical protein